MLTEFNKSDINLNIQRCKLPAGLYVVATPIGNLKDITIRALETLLSADIILCEDTRVTGKLLSHYAIKSKMVVYNDHSNDRTRQKIMGYLCAGQVVALVSDAGTPLISDPGYRLVNDAYDAGVFVTTLPGASAVISALTIAGLPTDNFTFYGFIPNKAQARKKYLNGCLSTKSTSIFFERASRINATLEDIDPQRNLAIIREISKKFEQVKKGTVVELLEYYAREGLPKGEVVIVVSPCQTVEIDDEKLDKLISEHMQTMSLKQAVESISKEFNISRKKVYNRALEIKNSGEVLRQFI